MQVKQEIRTFASKDIDGFLLFPGKWIITWVQAPFMPWILVAMEQFEGDV